MLKKQLKTETKSPDEHHNQKIAELFQKIADAGGLGIPNPDEWQQEIRQDRPLSFRDCDTHRKI